MLANVATAPPTTHVIRLYGVNTLTRQATAPIAQEIIQVFVIPNLDAIGPVRMNPRNVGISPTAPRSATMLSFPRIYFA